VEEDKDASVKASSVCTPMHSVVDVVPYTDLLTTWP